MNNFMVTKSGKGVAGKKNPGSRSQVFQGLGKTMLCFDPCRKALLVSRRHAKY